MLEPFGLENVGRNHDTAKRRIAEMGLNSEHFDAKVRTHAKSRLVDLSSVMTRDSSFSPGSIKRRALREGVLRNECYICGLGPHWRGAPLTLRLDHKNGDRRDARWINIRLLCPNCDSQQPTFCGRNYRRTKT